MKILLLVLLFAAPVLQIVLCVLRYRRKIILPVLLITILMLLLGFAFSYLAEYLVHPVNPPHPVMPMTLAFGLIITGWSVPIIGIITGIAYHLKRPILSTDEEVTAKVNEVLDKRYK